MEFFKNLFKKIQTKTSGDKKENVIIDLAPDESFVQHFIDKGGKFLYSTSFDEVINNLKSILLENNWTHLHCTDIDLLKISKKINVKTQQEFSKTLPFFTSCEHLIANNGDILFSHNQLGNNKLKDFSKDFIVYATTSQLVKNIGEGLTGIKTNFRGNIPTNISSIKSYRLTKKEESYMDYGNTNSKKLYLLLFEDF